MSKKNMGSSIDDFLKKENIFEEAQALSQRGRVVARAKASEPDVASDRA